MSVNEDVTVDFSVNDRGGAAKLTGFAKAADKIGSAFSRLTNIVGTIGGLAGAFGLAETVRGLDETYRAVERIKLTTGAGAEEAYELVDTFDVLGVSAQTTEMLMLRMTNKVRGMETGLQGSVKQTAKMASLYKRMGIDAKKGPEAMVLSMSAAATKGKLAVGDMQKMFGVGRGQAVDLMKVLQHGPEELKAQFKDSAASGDAINESALASWQRMQQAKRNLKDSFQELAGTVYKTLVPALTRVLTMMDSALKTWEPAAKKFGEFLVLHMDQAVAGAKLLGKLMLANKLLEMTGGGGLGKLAGRVGGFASGKLNVGEMLVGKGGAGAIGTLFQFLTAARTIMPIVQGLMRLGAVGLIIGVVVKAFSLFVHNVDGVRDRLTAIFDTIMAKVSEFQVVLTPVMDLIGVVFLGAAKALLWVVEAILDVVSTLMTLVQAMAIMVAKIVTSPLETARHPLDALFDAFTEAQAQTAATLQSDAIAEARKRAAGSGPSAPDARQAAQNNFDFRGSRFDIRQNFAEGFDPDRIAAVFAQDVAVLGERSMQSGFSPLMSIR